MRCCSIISVLPHVSNMLVSMWSAARLVANRIALPHSGSASNGPTPLVRPAWLAAAVRWRRPFRSDECSRLAIGSQQPPCLWCCSSSECHGKGVWQVSHEVGGGNSFRNLQGTHGDGGWAAASVPCHVPPQGCNSTAPPPRTARHTHCRRARICARCRVTHKTARVMSTFSVALKNCFRMIARNLAPPLLPQARPPPPLPGRQVVREEGAVAAFAAPCAVVPLPAAAAAAPPWPQPGP